jgi:hypothetical protein
MLRLKRHVILPQLGLALLLLAAACGGSGVEYAPLTADNPVAKLPEGLTLSVAADNLPDNFRLNLTAIPAETFAAGEAGESWAAALAALPSYLRLHSAVFNIRTEGDLPERMFLSVVVPSGAEAQRLDLYAWDGAAWSFLPAQVRGGQLVADVAAPPPPALALFENAPLPPLTLTTLEPGQSLTAESGAALNAVLLGGVLAQADGSLGGQVPGVPLDQSFAVLPVVRNHLSGEAEAATLAALLSDEAIRANHLQTLAGFAASGGYDGLVLDYLGVTPDLGPAFAQLVDDLAGQLHAQGKSLFVQLPLPTADGTAFNTGGYDWRVLGGSADALLLPMPADPAAYGNGAADNLLGWAVGEVPRGRLRLLTTALSVESSEGAFSLLDPAAALVPLGGVTVEDSAAQVVPGDSITVKLSGEVQSLTYDPLAFAASYTYDRAGAPRTVWLTSASTLRQRLALAEKYRLGGVAVNDLLAANVPAGMLAALTQYKASVQADAAAHAQLLWTVRNRDGIIALATAQPNQPYVYVAPVPGEYRFSADLQHGDSADLGDVAVEVAAITPTPSPEPTATTALNVGAITPAPTLPGGTPAPTSAVPTATSPPSDGGVFIPPPPIGAGTFELGGQVPGFIGNLGLMQQAHMRWVKFQCKPGCDYAGFIAAGKGAGFKVLLSAVGDHGLSSDPAYFPQYAAWVAGMSAAGADAIEVWNEANLDREWANGHINGANYTELLRQAYNAIKGSGGAMVISGAPAPTGAAGGAGCIAALCNDDVFLQQMAVAGAANYMDCVGVHYNTGTTSPNATTGSALSGYHYSYYFWPMVDLYWSSFGGTRPLCFTELGYLSAEGYGSLHPFFAWAADNTVAEQAQWLAEAASLAGNSGQVRMMIVFNVDFTHYSDDPQAGYAMRRPDGSCPACAALGAVVP